MKTIKQICILLSVIMLIINTVFTSTTIANSLTYKCDDKGLHENSTSYWVEDFTHEENGVTNWEISYTSVSPNGSGEITTQPPGSATLMWVSGYISSKGTYDDDNFNDVVSYSDISKWY